MRYARDRTVRCDAHLMPGAGVRRRCGEAATLVATTPDWRRIPVCVYCHRKWLEATGQRRSDEYPEYFRVYGWCPLGKLSPQEARFLPGDAKGDFIEIGTFWAASPRGAVALARTYSGRDLTRYDRLEARRLAGHGQLATDKLEEATA